MRQLAPSLATAAAGTASIAPECPDNGALNDPSSKAPFPVMSGHFWGYDQPAHHLLVLQSVKQRAGKGRGLAMERAVGGLEAVSGIAFDSFSTPTCFSKAEVAAF